MLNENRNVIRRNRRDLIPTYETFEPQIDSYDIFRRAKTTKDTPITSNDQHEIYEPDASNPNEQSITLIQEVPKSLTTEYMYV